MAATMQMHEMSKTYQYRKVMKPMLERKRRARINKCLDELKDLMVTTLESEGEHVTRLEKADILELTVQHLQKLKQKRKLGIDNNYQQNTIFSQQEGFRSGFIYAANEISRNLANLPGVNITFGTKLMTHLGQRLNQLQLPTTTTTSTRAIGTTPIINNNNSNLKIPIPLHHPITINCGGGHSVITAPTIISPQTSSSSLISPLSSTINSSMKTSSFGSYSVQLSPISNYSQSPKPHLMYETSIKSENINYCSGNFSHESEENVWRPW